ncbi:MAG: nuclear transport factor 2 family protein [Pseudomonadales bacterium]|nr:nuclear transport factor 2 family protein [Pseudomonadales bacterium]
MQVIFHAKHSAYLALVVLQLLITGCDSTPPENAIRQALEELEQAIEDGDTGTVMDRLTDTVSIEQHGRTMAREEIQRTLMALFFRYPKRQITITRVEIELDPVTKQQARVRFTAIVWGGRNLLPENGDSYRVVSDWRENGEWKIEALTADGLREGVDS